MSITFSRLTVCSRLFIIIVFALSTPTCAQKAIGKLTFDVTMPDPDNHLFHVIIQYARPNPGPVDFKMPVWTPGYYQLMNYARAVENFTAVDEAGKPIPWEKPSNSTWRIQASTGTDLRISYDVLATRRFVASNYLDKQEGYISPAGVFMYVTDQLQQPVTVTIHPYTGWKPVVATGLDSIPGKPNTFTAPNFDVLYDSPMLMGQLEQLPSFKVSDVPHYFEGYSLGTFDRNQFMTDLQKIVQAGSDIIGDIPYKHYTFLAIGPGGGGIEHLNSTSISFSGDRLNTPQGRLRTYLFLAHEYFHHYNVKRIRPVNLGPFNYDRENQTNMLWVSEGFTVYYEYLILRRAGLMTTEELLNILKTTLSAYENKPGHLFQSATQASYETWSDGPFGRTGDEAYKTISYYDKGAILGLLLDFAIRHETINKKSLDDVMRKLYHDYYQTKKRGFTDKEFQAVCEETAGRPLNELFTYASTVKPIDYPKYLTYAGLTIDTTLGVKTDTWTGLNVREKSDSILVTSADWESPAWKAGLRSGTIILKLNDQPATVSTIHAVKPDVPLKLLVSQQGKITEKVFLPVKKMERSFQITRLLHPDARQQALFNDWLDGGKQSTGK